MQLMMKYIELLAPARDSATGIDAVNFGADAVYIGPPEFGARASAGNSIADITSLIQYAHLYRAKVYATLNTLLYDHELEAAKNMIWQLYDSGIDAIIIQDMGLLEMDLPPVALHASTQTHNHNSEKIKFLESAGFQRVILARELSLDEITKIKEETSIELEAFVHGSLCVSYSGQCYLSQMVANRSANRGKCAQPCRSYYDLIDSNGKKILSQKYLLSLKDLNLAGNILQMIEAGITSFKIEGRLKDRNYVRNITGYYRKIIDNILNNNSLYHKSSSGRVNFDFTPDPYKTFNRDFTTYFSNGRQHAVFSPDTPKSTGELIGTVSATDSSGFTVESDKTLENGDGLLIKLPAGSYIGIRANKVISNRVIPVVPEAVPVGSLVYRNHDQKFSKLLENSATNRKIQIIAIYSENPTGISLELKDEDNITVILSRICDKKTVDNPEKFKETLISQLQKTGGTSFEITQITCNNPENFIRISDINAIRRDALDELKLQRINFYKAQPLKRHIDINFDSNKQLNYLANVINTKSKDFYEQSGFKVSETGLDETRDFEGKCLMTTKHCLKYEIGNCPKEHGDPIVKGIKYPLLLKDHTNEFLLEFDCSACIMKIKSTVKN